MSAPTLDISLVVLASNALPDPTLLKEMLAINRAELEKLGRPYEVLIVDDGIGGSFFEAAMASRAGWPELRIVRFRRPFGESVSLDTAVDLARGRYVVTSAWYQQTEVTSLERAIQLLDEGVDYVATRRTPRIDGVFARFQSWIFNSYTRWLTKVKVYDLNCSFRAFRKEVIEELSFHGDLFRFISIMAVQKGFRVQEIPVKHLREEGPSTFFSVGLTARRLLDILSLFFLIKFTRKPLRFFGLVGAVFFGTGSIICLFMLYVRLVLKEPLADRPMLVLGIFLVVLGVIVASIGLIGEIIIFTHGRNFRDYHIQEIIEGDPVEEPEVVR